MIGKYCGEFDEAADVYRRALAVNENHRRTHTDDIATILHNLGGLAHARGDPREAERLARMRIAVRTAQTDGNPIVWAGDDATLAAILVDLGRFAEARAILNSALTSYERANGRHLVEVAAALHNLGPGV
jgi:Flp pilus assembly protein TadD